MSRQDQDVAGGEGYQAGLDLIVNKALSTEQMADIMIALAGQLGTYLNKAEETAQARYRELREDLIAEFANPGTKADTSSFADPDYQFVLRDAHESYARSGKVELREELVKLLVERSTQPPGTRTALILNDAIRTTGSLTFEEISVLAVIFIIKHIDVQQTSVDNVAIRYDQLLSPFVDNLTQEVYSFEYLESLGCATIERVADHFPLDEHIQRNYGHIAPDSSAAAMWNTVKGISRSLRVLEDLWPKAFYRQTNLTALGKAIAHSALESKSVINAPLSVWVR